MGFMTDDFGLQWFCLPQVGETSALKVGCGIAISDKKHDEIRDSLLLKLTTNIWSDDPSVKLFWHAFMLGLKVNHCQQNNFDALSSGL